MIYALADLHDLAADLGCEVRTTQGGLVVAHHDHGTLCTVPPDLGLEAMERRVRAELGIRQASAAGSGLITIHFGGQR